MSTSFGAHVALFGGSFNPPHLGHVHAVRGLKKNPGVGRVVVVPSRGTPLKTVDVAYEDRLEMAKLAFASEADVSDIEGREQLTFTFELLERYRAIAPKLAFVIGTDQFLGFRGWKRFPQVLSMCDWIVLLRKSADSAADLAAVTAMQAALRDEGVLSTTKDPSEWRIAGSERVMRFVETDAPEISSTRIRENFALNRSPENAAWIPRPVLEWIERKHIYGT